MFPIVFHWFGHMKRIDKQRVARIKDVDRGCKWEVDPGVDRGLAISDDIIQSRLGSTAIISVKRDVSVAFLNSWLLTPPGGSW